MAEAATVLEIIYPEGAGDESACLSPGEFCVSNDLSITPSLCLPHTSPVKTLTQPCGASPRTLQESQWDKPSKWHSTSQCKERSWEKSASVLNLGSVHLLFKLGHVFKKKLFVFNWRIIALQYCINLSPLGRQIVSCQSVSQPISLEGSLAMTMLPSHPSVRNSFCFYFLLSLKHIKLWLPLSRHNPRFSYLRSHSWHSEPA